MNTAARDRALLPTVKDVLGRKPISKLKLSKQPDGSLKVALHTSRPNDVRMESAELTRALTERIGGEKTVKVEVVAEARAVAKFVKTSPRKARLVIDAIKGKRVSEALGALRFIPNHAAELISKVVASAAANAQDGWGAEPEELKVHNILADGGPTMKRVRARAQGRAYRILKRSSHLTVILIDAPAPVRRKPAASKKAAATKKTVAPAPKTSKVAQAEAPAVEATTAPVESTTVEAPAVIAEGEGE
jgi:large subunit ribosomal protein L22